jgi:phosphoribosylformimino-5-aminoimidazole carboxamide ribotide isomerase
MRIIPAIDIIEGKCVRLTKGDYNTKKIYNENPLEVAKQFEDAGIEYLHVVDLDGAKSKHIVNHKVLEQIASKTNLKIDFGGGLKSDEDAKIAFESGANQITGGSIAVKNPDVVVAFITDYEEIGVEYVICTDVAKDGMLEGTSNELYKEILETTKVKLIASGGVSNLDDLFKVQELGCEGVIVGKAIYENKISLKELEQFIINK